MSVATLSMWQTGVRHPGRSVSFEVIRELESLIGLQEGELQTTLGPPRRVRRGVQLSYASLVRLPPSPFTTEMETGLTPRSSSVGAFVDADARVTRTLHRTLWQACEDGAREATVFFVADHEAEAPEVRGTLGCSLSDVRIDRDLALLRATLSLDAPLAQGSVALTERESVRPADYPHEYDLTLVALRRQAELTVFAVFDPDLVPRMCRVTVESAEGERSHRVPLNGTAITHTEFDFGPGTITLDWEF
ncbi:MULTISPECIES: hypothetical protein [unclassified Microbacterium]|uniref:hypothetical protein n=1 Tax=unclassified Microbacterium TaxID=2609290 RepID=UPI00128EA49B|nr:hypothetical protein [Microbacterium sp. GCS4]